MADNPLPIEPRRPWQSSAFWRKQWGQIIAASRILSRDPTTLALLLRYIETLGRHGVPIAPTPHDPPVLVTVRECVGPDPALLARVREDIGADPDTVLAALCARIKLVSPPLRHGLTGNLPLFVMDMAVALMGAFAGVPVEDLPFEVRITRFLPDNPLMLEPDGTLRGYSEARPKHFLQLHSALNAHRPLRRRGPRPKPPGAVPIPRSLNPELAERAYQLHLHRKSDRQIAKALLPAKDLKGLSREAVRHRGRRLVERGERLHHQKIVTTPQKPVR